MATHTKLEVKNHIAYIILFEENAKKPCTLDWDVLREMDICLDEIENQIDTLHAIVLESDSEKSFVVGANIATLEELTPITIMEWVRLGHRIFNRFSSISIPTIAKVKRLAIGGGLELAMACDFIIASDLAKVGQPEASLGVMPGWGGSYRLAALIGPARAKELFMSARLISAQMAYEWGIVNHVCKEGEIDVYVDELVMSMAKNDRQVIQYLKKFINGNFYQGMSYTEDFEAISSSICLASDGTKQRLEDFFSSRKNKN